MSKRKGEDSNAPQWVKVLCDLVELRDTTLIVFSVIREYYVVF